MVLGLFEERHNDIDVLTWNHPSEMLSWKVVCRNLRNER